MKKYHIITALTAKANSIYIHDACPKRTKAQLCYLKELMPKWNSDDSYAKKAANQKIPQSKFKA